MEWAATAVGCRYRRMKWGDNDDRLGDDTRIDGAATFVDGDALYRSCQANPQAYCQGYVTGVIDAASEVMDELDQKPVFCPGEEITVAQARDAVIAFLKDNPGARDQGASGLIIAAMAKAFPCKI